MAKEWWSHPDLRGERMPWKGIMVLGVRCLDASGNAGGWTWWGVGLVRTKGMGGREERQDLILERSLLSKSYRTSVYLNSR